MSAISISRRGADSLVGDQAQSFFQPFLEFARGRVDAYRKARAIRRAHRQVLAMSDYQLKDIGVSRCEINARVFGPPSRSGRAAD